MTINILVAVAEGLVMAADSWSQMADEQGNVSTTHSSTEKLTEIGDRQIAVMIHGLGAIDNRSILSLIREFEFAEYAKAPRQIDNWSVTETAEELGTFVASRYDQAYPDTGDDSEKPTLGLVLGGYSPGEFFPEAVKISFPGPVIERQLPSSDPAEKPFGGWYVDFWGVRTALNRLLFGFDVDSLEEGYAFLRWARDQRTAGRTDLGHIPEPPVLHPHELLQPLAPLQTIDHRLDGMPLQEAVEFADFLGMVAIGYDKFSKGMRSVGGDLDVLAIQPEGLSWYRRKPFAAQMATARERRKGRV